MRFAPRSLDGHQRRPTSLSPMVIRPLERGDAEELTALRLRNRANLEPWELDADDSERWYTVKGVCDWITDGQARFAIVDGGEVAGMLSLTGIERGPIQTAMLSYFVDEAHAGRGLATRAVAEAVRHAFGELGLHRVEAGTAVANIASQRVLEHNRFTLVGTLRRHLLLRGVWTDHLLWERLAEDE
jgi:[ribosomal protein S5]-alanine N-acetyltransferase